MCPEGSCGPWRGAHTGGGFLAGPVAHGSHPCWSSLRLKDCAPWKGHMLEQFLKNCSLSEGLTLERFVKDCILWDRPRVEQGNSRDELLQTDHNSPFPISPWELVGKWSQCICARWKQVRGSLTPCTTVFQLQRCNQAVNIGQASQLYFRLKGGSMY